MINEESLATGVREPNRCTARATDVTGIYHNLRCLREKGHIGPHAVGEAINWFDKCGARQGIAVCLLPKGHAEPHAAEGYWWRDEPTETAAGVSRVANLRELLMSTAEKLAAAAIELDSYR